MIAAADVKLGRLAVRRDARTLRFARYVQPAVLPPLPTYVHWSQKCSKRWGMMGNDRAGDCTCAAIGHGIQGWTANHGSELTLPDDVIIAAYSAVSGYDPATGANDNGAVELDVLNFWRKTGIAGHKIGAFCALDMRDAREVKEALYLFGGIYLGVALPAAWQGQSIWRAPHFRFDFGHPAWRPGSWGGHAIWGIDYDAAYLTVVTWGTAVKVEWAAVQTYFEEGYAVISEDWVSNTNKAPNGFDMATLVQDLAELGKAA